jgi:hypothetical protein
MSDSLTTVVLQAKGMLLCVALPLLLLVLLLPAAAAQIPSSLRWCRQRGRSSSTVLCQS